MKLIREEVQDIKYLVEENKKTGEKNYRIEGIFMMAEKQNKNGRVYPFDVLNGEVNRYTNEYVSKGRALGELGHPDTPAVDLNNACILIKKLNADGHNFMGSANILNTPKGNTVKGLLDGGVTLGVSTRGVGSLKPHNGYQLVQPDFKLSAVDVVGDPSAPDAFVKGIMEGVDWFYDNGHWKMAQMSEDVKKQIKTFSKRQIEEKALDIFKSYISKL
jgi:hypothetical protein